MSLPVPVPLDPVLDDHPVVEIDHAGADELIILVSLARQQDQVLPRERLAEEREDRVGQLHDPGDRAEQAEPEDQRQPDPDPPRPGALR